MRGRGKGREPQASPYSEPGVVRTGYGAYDEWSSGQEPEQHIDPAYLLFQLQSVVGGNVTTGMPGAGFGQPQPFYPQMYPTPPAMYPQPFPPNGQPYVQSSYFPGYSPHHHHHQHHYQHTHHHHHQPDPGQQLHHHHHFQQPQQEQHQPMPRPTQPVRPQTTASVKMQDLNEFPVLGGKKKDGADPSDAGNLKIVHKAPQATSPHHHHHHHHVAPPRQIVAAASKAPPDQGKKGGNSWAALAAAAPRKPASPGKMPVCYFSKFLWTQCRRAGSMQHVLNVEKLFNQLLLKPSGNLAGNSKMMASMNKEKRAVVHELGLHYGMSVESVDKEPNRSCFVRRLPASRFPRVLLSEWFKLQPREDPDLTAQRHLLEHPHHAIVFPKVPAAVTSSTFNTLFIAFTGQWLILRRKPTTTSDPTRAVIAVFLTGKVDAALASLDKSPCRFDYHKYSSWRGADADKAEYGQLLSDGGGKGDDASTDEEGCDEGSDKEDEGGEQKDSSPLTEKRGNEEWVSLEKGPSHQVLAEERYTDHGWVKNTFSGLKRDED